MRYVLALVFLLAFPNLAVAALITFTATVEDAYDSSGPGGPEFWVPAVPLVGEEGFINVFVNETAMLGGCSGSSCAYDWTLPPLGGDPDYNVELEFSSGSWSTSADYVPFPPYFSDGWINYTDGDEFDRLELYLHGGDVESVVLDLVTASTRTASDRANPLTMFDDFVGLGWAGTWVQQDNATRTSGHAAAGAPIPEPEAYVQFVLGASVVGLALWRRILRGR